MPESNAMAVSEIQDVDELVQLADRVEQDDKKLAKKLRLLIQEHATFQQNLVELEKSRQGIELARREWETAVDAIQDPIFLHDKTMRVIRANHAYAKLVGMDIRDVIGRDYWELLPGLEGPTRGCAEALEKQENVEEEIELSNGRQFICRSYPVNDSRNEYLYSLHVMQDVTEKRRADKEQRILSEAVHQATEAVVVLDEHSLITYVNPAFENLLGYTPEEIRGKPLSVLAMTDGSAETRPDEVIDYLNRTGQWYGEVFRRAKDGSAIPVLLSAVSLRDEDGNISGYVGTYLDLREIRNAEETLYETRQRFRLLIENSSDIVSLLDKDGCFRYVSPSIMNILGYTPEEMVDTQALSVIHVDDRDRVNQVIENAVQNPDKIYSVEYRVQHKTDGYIYVESIGRSLLDEPAVAGVVVNTRDITERKNAEQAIYHVNRALKTMSGCNATMIHADDEDELLQDICNVIFETGEYPYVWIGYAEYDETKRIKPMAQAGFEAGFLEALPLTWEDNESGRNPSGLAIRENAAVMVGDIDNEETLTAWKEPLQRLGIASVVSFPLQENNKVFAVLTICSCDTNAYDHDELMLLSELSEDLNFGILTMRYRKVHERLQEENLETAEHLERTFGDTIRAIALTVEKRDPYTAGHQQQVAELCKAIGYELGLDNERIIGLHLGAMIHDIGKIYVPSEILNRPGRLTAPEFEIIQTHPQVGYEIIKDVSFPWPVGEMILQHHERLDGSGYPKGLAGEEIILEARILAVADTVEAMVAHRPYRPSRGIKIALDEITSQRGQLYDAAVVDACLKLFSENRFAFADN